MNHSSIIQLGTGDFIDVFDPETPWENFVENICICLGRLPRYVGNTRVPFTVAEHSLLCLMNWIALSTARGDDIEVLFKGTSVKVSFTEWKRTALDILTHDFAESLFNDIPSPIKKRYPDLERDEVKVLGYIRDRICPRDTGECGLESAVEFIDQMTLALEYNFLTRSGRKISTTPGHMMGNLAAQWLLPEIEVNPDSIKARTPPDKGGTVYAKSLLDAFGVFNGNHGVVWDQRSHKTLYAIFQNVRDLTSVHDVLSCYPVSPTSCILGSLADLYTPS